MQFSLRTALVAVFALALVMWPTTSCLRTYLANRGLVLVQGRVIFNGQPLLAKVMLSPKAGGVPVQSVTNAVGDYALLVKPDEYTVSITEIGTGKRLPLKFAEVSMSGLSVTVREDGDNHFAFDLRD